MPCCAWFRLLKASRGRRLLGSNHNTAPTFNDTFYGVSVSELACESLRRPSIEIRWGWLQIGADSFLVLFPLLSKICVKTSERRREGELCSISFSQSPAACLKRWGVIFCLWISELNTDSLTTNITSCKPKHQCSSGGCRAFHPVSWWLTEGSWDSKVTGFDAAILGTHGICAPWPSTQSLYRIPPLVPTVYTW